MKATFQQLLFILCTLVSRADQAQDLPGQILQINTHFSAITGDPTWQLIVRDVQTGQVLPYLYDIKNDDNFWIAFTAGRSYRITVSNITFGPYAKIDNVCHLENGIISGQSMWIMLSGELSPDSKRFKCHVKKYHDSRFTIVKPQSID